MNTETPPLVFQNWLQFYTVTDDEHYYTTISIVTIGGQFTLWQMMNTETPPLLLSELAAILHCDRWWALNHSH